MSARSDPSIPCCFCNLTEDDELQYGKFYEYDGIVTHYYCLLLSSNMEQKGKDEEGIFGFLSEDIHKELRRGKRLTCSYCKKNGATLGCCNIRCKRIFHLPCGLKSDSLHQFFGEFRSYCVNHRPKQNTGHILKQIESLNNMLCYICYDIVDPKNLLNILWAPCCKKDAWFHRKCIQQLALSAGYFFKCPLCNNSKDFEAAMLEHGIFIPSQDASWELVPNAFEELLYRHNQCDAVKCLCPKGRKYTSRNAKWELALCQICGSQGIHMFCGELKWVNPKWECAECTSILNNSSTENESDDNSKSQKNSDMDSDSDSDISVGTELPLFCETQSFNFTSSLISESSMDSVASLKLRPGPRCFKLQQLLELEKMNDCSNDSNSAKLLSKELQQESHIKDEYEENETSKESISQESLNKSAKDDSQKRQSKKCQLIPQCKEANVITIESDNDDEVQIISFNQENSSTPLQPTQSDISFAPGVISLNNDDLEDTNATDTNEISVMNIKISNVTSLPAEVFEYEPNAICENVELNTNSVETLHFPVKEDSLDISLPKRNMCEEENNAAKNYKKIKVNNFKSFCPNSANVSEQKNGRISSVSSTETCEDNHSNCTSASTNRISNLSQNNDLPAQMTFQKTVVSYADQIESNFSVESGDVQQSEKSTVSMRTINNKSVYNIPQKYKNVYRKSISNTNLTNNQKAGIKNAYNTLLNDAILPQVKNKHEQTMTVVKNNRQIRLVTQATTNAVISTTMEENEKEALDQQKSNLAKKIVPVNESSLGNNSLDHTFCDGDAGTDLTGTDSTAAKEDQFSESYESVEADCSERLATTRGIFPRVTNNHNTCHQPRLTPQYMDLRDLKFRVCESGSVQMILYDTFSVNIPVDYSRKRKIRPASSVEKPELKRLCTSASRSRSEASSSFDYLDGVSTTEQYVDTILRSTRNENHLVNDKTKCITRDRYKAKENLDPVKSKTLSRRFNNVNLTSEADDMVIKSNCNCGENDDEIRVISSDNPSALNRTNSGMNVDNVTDGVEFVSSDCNENFRTNLEKQPNEVSSTEERNDGAFCKETLNNFDFNIINANKNVEKVLHDDITVFTKENQHIDDGRIIIGDQRTNNTPRLWNNGKHLNSTNITRLKAQNRRVTQISNVILNKHSIYKQINAYDSRKYLQCKTLNENFINHNGNNRLNCSNDSFKISINLDKIQNLIDAKPELFVNGKRNDERYKYTSRRTNCVQQR